MKGDVGISCHKKRTRTRPHEARKSIITPSLHICQLKCPLYVHVQDLHPQTTLLHIRKKQRFSEFLSWCGHFLLTLHTYAQLGSTSHFTNQQSCHKGPCVLSGIQTSKFDCVKALLCEKRVKNYFSGLPAVIFSHITQGRVIKHLSRTSSLASTVPTEY